MQFSAPMTPNQFFVEGSTVIAWDLGFVFNISTSTRLRHPMHTRTPETTSAPHRVAQRSGRRSVEFIVLALVVRDAEPFEFLFRVQLQEDLVPLALAARSFCSGLSWRFRWLVAE